MKYTALFLFAASLMASVQGFTFVPKATSYRSNDMKMFFGQKKKAPEPKQAPAPVAPTPTFSSEFAGGLSGVDVEFKKGFDPWGLSLDRDEATLNWYRSAELKHGRVCMLAALGIITQTFVHLPDDVFANPKSIDALYQVGSERPLALIQILLAIGAVETVSLLSENDDAEPGDLGWDPLNLQKALNLDDPDKMSAMKLKELKNGRLAMVSVAGMLYQEYLTGQGTVDQLTSGHLNPFGDGQGVF
jgi:hypothetical protein